MKKINLDQVCSVKICIKSVNTSYEYAKPRTFLFYFKRGEGFYYSSFGAPKFMTKEEVEAENKNFYCEGQYVFYKPHIELRTSDQHYHTRFFETEQDLRNFINSPEFRVVTWVEM